MMAGMSDTDRTFVEIALREMIASIPVRWLTEDEAAGLLPGQTGQLLAKQHGEGRWELVMAAHPDLTVESMAVFREWASQRFYMLLTGHPAEDGWFPGDAWDWKLTVREVYLPQMD